MLDFCPDERYFDQAFTGAKEALRKYRQRLNEQAREKKNPSSRR